MLLPIVVCGPRERRERERERERVATTVTAPGAASPTTTAATAPVAMAMKTKLDGIDSCVLIQDQSVAQYGIEATTVMTH